jgi:tellurium resistance protein TerZ
MSSSDKPTYPTSLLAGVTISVQVIAGRNLVAKDCSFFGRKKTASDPYVRVRCGNETYGRTRTVKKNCESPSWNETVKIELGVDKARAFLLRHLQQPKMLDLCIYDEDLLSFDDSMGLLQIPITYGSVGIPTWFPVTPGAGSYHCANATGELQVCATLQVHQMLDLRRGNTVRSNQLPYGNGRLTIGLSWDIEQGKTVDLDSCCVAMDRSGKVLLNETVYFGNRSDPTGSIVHSGDDTAGLAPGDDECIRIDLNRIPTNVLCMYFLLFVAGPLDRTFSSVKSAQVRVLSTENRFGICRFVPSDLGEGHTAVFLMRIARSDGTDWFVSPIADSTNVARDFGSLMPQLKAYARDLVPNIVVNPYERIAMMRKDGTIRIEDYFPDFQIPEWLTFGLAWSVTYGVEIDLDASAMLLDHKLQLVDTVWFQKRTSNDFAIRHCGDEREGDTFGDDEKIRFSLRNVSPNVAYIGLVINSFSGQQLDDVHFASCHLFDPKTNTDVAKYSLTNCKSLNHHTALVMACFYRSPTPGGEWCLRIIAEPAQGRHVHENVDELQRFLRAHPAPVLLPPPAPDMEFLSMPAVALVEEDIVVTIPEEEIHVILD